MVWTARNGLFALLNINDMGKLIWFLVRNAQITIDF